MFNELNENALYENEINHNDSTNRDSQAFLKQIKLYLQSIIYYYESITNYDKEENNMAIELNKNWEYLKTNIDYEKEQSLEKKIKEDRNNSKNLNIDKFGFFLFNIVKIKMIEKEYENDEQDIGYELSFEPKGVYLKEKNDLFEKIRISDGTYQKGKIIKFENGETKKKLLIIILIKNTETESEMLFCSIDLFKNIKDNYIYPSKIPPIKDFTIHMLDKNDKKQVIILLSCEIKIYVVIFEFDNIEQNDKNNFFELCEKTKIEYIFEEFKPISICPIRTFTKDDLIFKKYKVFSKFFLVSSQTNIKLFKYNEEGQIIFICDIEFENQEHRRLIEEKPIYKIEQLDNGIITIYLEEKKINGYLFLDK